MAQHFPMYHGNLDVPFKYFLPPYDVYWKWFNPKIKSKIVDSIAKDYSYENFNMFWKFEEDIPEALQPIRLTVEKYEELLKNDMDTPIFITFVHA
jgi:hypothetical protein